ncbi:MAG TPA: ABC transporter permease [Rhizomicrobium sp.]|jgi:putative ABC transport system permease protein|nr:ABC transporter permease [Rhizomicrobium sp.]
MFQHFLLAAWRNILANKLQSAIAVLGLAIGFTAAILIALYVRDEFSYDRFVPGYQDVYRVALTLNAPSIPPAENNMTEVWTAPLLRRQFPQIQYAARLARSFYQPLVKHDAIQASEQRFLWADPDFFKVFPLAAVAGDPATALDRPESLVVSRAMARKYFGRDDAVGQTLLVDGQPMRITAVIADLPSNSHLLGDFFGAGISQASALKQLEKMNGVGDFFFNTFTYIRLKPGVSPEPLEKALPQFFATQLPMQPTLRRTYGNASVAPYLVPLADIHLWRTTTAQPSRGDLKPVGDRQVIGAVALVGILIVLIAGINFVTLMTARAGRRAMEVGVRKSSGALRRQLIGQFLGEAMFHAAVAMVLAISFAEILLPPLNGFLRRGMAFNYLGDPALGLGIPAAMLAVGLLAGTYPAFVLSSFRPAQVLKGGLICGDGTKLVREGLVILQFVILTGLILGTITIYRQTDYALNEGMRVNKDQVLLAFGEPCTANFRDEVRALPGVKYAACSSSYILGLTQMRDAIIAGPRRVDANSQPVDFGFFDVYDIKPLAGRLFDQKWPADDLQTREQAGSNLVLNETAVRKLGFTSPQAAVGRSVMWRGAPVFEKKDRPARPATIIGVVPDFTFDSMRSRIDAAFFFVGPKVKYASDALNIKLTGTDISQTMKAIDAVWRRLGDGQPLTSVFVDRFMMRLYVDSILQGIGIAVCAGLALFIACLGLFALSAFTAEQRTKEIGVRKAMGATSANVALLLLWQFGKPVLWANLIAWPLAFWLMNRWLNGFAYHVAMPLWLFPAAGLGTLAIALITVAAQSWITARQKPVLALRYE